jgi:hypothetical protein
MDASGTSTIPSALSYFLTLDPPTPYPNHITMITNSMGESSRTQAHEFRINHLSALALMRLSLCSCTTRTLTMQ